MTKSGILNPSPGQYLIFRLFYFFHLSIIGIYEIILSWIPVADQYGVQPFCGGAIDNSSLQSNQWCITFLVGFNSPVIIQTTASPKGTIFQNQNVFSIQSNFASLF